jgi:hypothetical protein
MAAKKNKKKLFAPLDEATLEKAEKRIGFALPSQLRELYSTEGNGGVGPGGALLGLDGGHVDDNGQCALDLYERWFSKPATPLWPEGMLPIAYQGCNTYLCVDLKPGKHAVFRFDGSRIDFSDGAPTKKAFAEAFARVAPTLSAWLTVRSR